MQLPETTERNWPSKERSFTELRFASFPYRFCGTERAVKDQDDALRAPLTALYVSNRREVVFSLDSADAFIDSR